MHSGRSDHPEFYLLLTSARTLIPHLFFLNGRSNFPAIHELLRVYHMPYRANQRSSHTPGVKMPRSTGQPPRLCSATCRRCTSCLKLMDPYEATESTTPGAPPVNNNEHQHVGYLHPTCSCLPDVQPSPRIKLSTGVSFYCERRDA